MASGDQSSLYLNEIRSLSELPMNRLIHLRSSFASNNGKSFSLNKFIIKTQDRQI